jgi:hypothetical protein
MYLGDTALQKELKLSEAQVKKLDEQRDKLGGLFSFDPAQREETMKAIDKAFADILEPAQVKRLRQVVMQQLEHGPIVVGARVLAGTPEVVEGLKLTDEQKARITPGTRLTALLTDDQMKAWKSLTGEPFETALQLRFGVALGRAALPASVQYLLQQPVADELKLSEAQSKKVAEMRDRWQKEFPTVVRTEEERKKLQTMTAAVEKEVGELLDATQNKRLKQIALQQSLTNGREAFVFTMPDAVKELKLTDDQNAKIKSIQEERRKALLPLFVADENSATIAKKVEAHKKETYAQLLAVLNDGQQAHLKEMIGEPVKGQVRPASAFGGRGGFVPSATFRAYLSITGVLFTDSKPLQEELKLNEVQIKQLAELRTKTQDRTGEIGPSVAGNEQSEKLRAELARDNEKALAEILQPQQLTRLKQVILQFYAQGRPVPSPFLGRFVEVSEGLALTREQKDRLQQGAELARVLDEKQQAKWKAMLGEPFANVASLSTGFRFRGRGGRVLNTQLEYLDEKSVREDLKLADGQIKRLPELSQKWDELTRDVLNGPPSEETTRKLAEARAALGKAVAGVLDEKQVARLRQIERQQLQKQGQGTLLAEAEVQKELALSEDQVTKITAINEDARATRNMISIELLRRVNDRVDEDYTRTIQAFNKIADGKLNALLAQAQHDRLRAMLGEPFKGEIRSGFIPGGGFGGFPIGGVPTAPAPMVLGVVIATEDGKAGALIREVIADTPAAKAGLKAGDRIRSVGGKAVEGVAGLRALVAGFKGGDKTEVVFERDGKEEKVQVEFDAAPPATRTAPSGISTSRGDDKPGALVSRLRDGSPAAKAGLKNGDRIVEVAGKAVKDRTEWLDLLRGFKAGEKVEIVVERDGKKEKLTYLAE